MLFGSVCVACGAPGSAICGACIAACRAAPPFVDDARPGGLTSCQALLAYDGPARALVVELKYRNARAALGILAAALASQVGAVGAEVDAVTWAPTSARRRRARGFDQAELLGRAVARALRRPSPALLRRLPGPPQTGRDLAARAVGPRFALRHPPPASVLVVDDVITTGATLSAAANTLLTGGATAVHGLAVARTPAPGRATRSPPRAT